MTNSEVQHTKDNTKNLDDTEMDLGHKIAELNSRSSHPKFDHVGYIRWVEDNIEEDGEIVIQIDYPNEQRDFKEAITYPKDLKVDSKLKQLIEQPDLPFSEGSFTNEDLQDEAVPINPEEEEIEIPPQSSSVQNAVNFFRNADLISTTIVLLCFGVTIVSLLSIIIVFFNFIL